MVKLNPGEETYIVQQSRTTGEVKIQIKSSTATLEAYKEQINDHNLRKVLWIVRGKELYGDESLEKTS